MNYYYYRIKTLTCSTSWVQRARGTLLFNSEEEMLLNKFPTSKNLLEDPLLFTDVIPV